MKQDQLPPQIRYVYLFQAFNSISWQMCLAGPLILFARELGASALALGILAGLTPLASIVQMPFAQRAERIGYKRLDRVGLDIAHIHPRHPGAAARRRHSHRSADRCLHHAADDDRLHGAARRWHCGLAAVDQRAGAARIRGLYLSRDRFFVNTANLLALALVGRDSGRRPPAYGLFSRLRHRRGCGVHQPVLPAPHARCKAHHHAGESMPASAAGAIC